jgi:hypothetical protein
MAKKARKKTSSSTALRQVTTAVERLKKKAKDRGKPLTATQISKARREMQATIKRQNAKRK